MFQSVAMMQYPESDSAPASSSILVLLFGGVIPYAYSHARQLEGRITPVSSETKTLPAKQNPMKPIIQFQRCSISLAVRSTVLILALASADIASAQVHNTKTGVNAGASITTGDEDTADGFSALQLTNTGSFNTAVGSLALQKNTAGINNTAVGYQALTLNNATASGNTALGSQALERPATTIR